MTDETTEAEAEDVTEYVPISVEHIRLGLAAPEGWTLPAVRLAGMAGKAPLHPEAPGTRARLGLFVWDVMGHAHCNGG